MGMGACCGIGCMLCQPATRLGLMMPLSMAPALAPPQTLCSGSGLLLLCILMVASKILFKKIMRILMRQQTLGMLVVMASEEESSCAVRMKSSRERSAWRLKSSGICAGAPLGPKGGPTQKHSRLHHTFFTAVTLMLA